MSRTLLDKLTIPAILVTSAVAVAGIIERDEYSRVGHCVAMGAGFNEVNICDYDHDGIAESVKYIEFGAMFSLVSRQRTPTMQEKDWYSQHK